MPASRREFLAAMAAPAIVRSSQEKRGRGGREPERLPDIPTPALLLDLDAFESNVAKMAVHLKARGKAFRPHGKTHKCPRIGQALARQAPSVTAWPN